MFSNEDIREIIHSFPPTAKYPNQPPPLVLSTTTQNLLTLSQLRTDYDRRVTTEQTRISVSQLAQDLDIPPPLLLTLVQNSHQLALLSKDERQILPTQQVAAHIEKLHDLLFTSAVGTFEIERELDVDFAQWRGRCGHLLGELVVRDEYLCTRDYDERLKMQVLSIMKRAVETLTTINLSTKDVENLPQSPPKPLFLHHLHQLATSTEYSEKLLIRQLHNDVIRIQSAQMKQRSFEKWSEPLLAGSTAFADLHDLIDGDDAAYENLTEVSAELKSFPELEVLEGRFVISGKWLSSLVNEKIKSLDADEVGVVDVSHELETTFPNTLSGHMERRTEENLVSALTERKNNDPIHRFGLRVYSHKQYVVEKEKLLESAAENAIAQWDQLKEDAGHEMKLSPDKSQSILATEKKTQKACEERFWSTVSALEAENEVAFATYWTERVSSRVHVYAQGLESIPDPKLQTQLAELVATHVQKDLVPEAMGKARTQNLVLSRKTRKNMEKLAASAMFTSTAVEFSVLRATLDTFAKKQALPSPSPDFKETMLQDMHRRMAKTNDGPVLYLSLIIVLLGRYFHGLVYATGKFAPKLMKQLKDRVSEEEYARLESWKEGAKKASLTEEDRAAMRALARGEYS